MAEAHLGNHLSIDTLDSVGRAPLHWAAQGGHVDSLERLIEAGANVHAKDRFLRTPLHLAAGFNMAKCMRRLLLAGCCVDQRDTEGGTALHSAVNYGSLNAARLLLSKVTTRTFANARSIAAAKDSRQRLPLHLLSWAVPQYVSDVSHEAVQELAGLLLDAYPGGINSRDCYGQPPLCSALIVDNLPLSKILVRAGASMIFRNALGQTLLDVAA
jgi:ankyrin repeat protein